MSKGVILYQSKYGATKKYVDWLREETGFDVMETPKATISEVIKYDKIILCGGIYASGVAGISFLRKNYGALKSKKIAIFCAGASPYEEKAFEEVKAHNLKEDLKEIPCFYGRGAWNEGAMKFTDKMLCKMLNKAIAKQDPSTYEPWMAALVEAKGQTCDWTKKEYLEPLISYIKE